MNLDRRRAVGARRNIGRKRHLRTQDGFHMVETLVALVVGAGIAFALTTLLSQTMRESSTTQNESLANQMAFNLLDFLKKQDFQSLKDLEGAAPVLIVNRSVAGQEGQFPRKDPTILDFVNQEWSDEAKNNKFSGNANLKVETGPINNSIRVVLAVTWNSSQTGSSRTIVTSTVITEKGAQEWKQ